MAEIITLKECFVSNRLKSDGTVFSHAEMWLQVNGQDRDLNCGEGVGPIAAADHIIRKELNGEYPEIDLIRLIDYGLHTDDPVIDGTESAVTVYVSVQYNGTPRKFSGKSANQDIAGIYALINAYNDCLTVLIEKRHA